MDLITLATIIVATFVAWLCAFICERNAVPSHITIALSIFGALFVFAFWPALVGG